MSSALSDGTTDISTIDIDVLLNSIDNNHYLKNKTLDDVSIENQNALVSLQMNETQVEEYSKKLFNYRLVENLFEVQQGKHIRWIRNNDTCKKLTNGGIVLEVCFFDKGSYILCKSHQHRLFQIKFDDCIIFQKCSQIEQVILWANNRIT